MVLRNSFFAFSMAACVISFTACAQDDRVLELDAYAQEFSEEQATPRVLGIVDMMVFEGEDTDNDDCLIWDIKDGCASDGQSGEHLLLAIDDEFLLPDGTVTCRRVNNTLESTEEVRAVVGGEEADVVFTIWGRWVFDGQLELAGKSFWQRIRELATKLLYTFDDDQIMVGPAFHDDVLLTATENVQWTSREQKLLLTALIEGECGAPGLEAATGYHGGSTAP